MRTQCDKSPCESLRCSLLSMHDCLRCALNSIPAIYVYLFLNQRNTEKHQQELQRAKRKSLKKIKTILINNNYL